MSDLNQFLERCREWQKENPDWELCCDIHDSENLYIQWHDLIKNERMSWIGEYGSAAEDAFEEFAIKTCKIKRMVLDEDMKLHDIDDWPYGNAMTVFQTFGYEW